MVREEQADNWRVEDNLSWLSGNAGVFIPVDSKLGENGEATEADIENDHGDFLMLM